MTTEQINKANAQVTKPGWQTTEFWVMLLPWAFSLLNNAKVIHVPESDYSNLAANIAPFIVSMIYLFGRTQAKTAAAQLAATAIANTGVAPTAPAATFQPPAKGPGEPYHCGGCNRDVMQVKTGG